MTKDLKDPAIDFYAPFQSGEGVCNPIYPKNYYNTQYTPMFDKQTGGKKRQMIYSNGVDLNLDGGKKRKSKNQKGGNLGAVEKFNMFGESESGKVNEKFESNNLGIPYATQAGGKKKTKKSCGGSNAAEYYTGKLVGKYAPSNLYSDDVKSQEKCGGKKKLKGGYPNVEGNSMNANQADGSLNRLNNTTKGGGINYRDSPKAGEPSNFSKGDIFHPEWSYSAKGGKKTKQQQGGNYIPIPGAIPMDVAANVPAGAQVQMGYGDHIMKASKDLGGFLAGEGLSNLPGNIGQNLQAAWGATGGKKGKSSQKKNSNKKNKSNQKNNSNQQNGGNAFTDGLVSGVQSVFNMVKGDFYGNLPVSGASIATPETAYDLKSNTKGIANRLQSDLYQNLPGSTASGLNDVIYGNTQYDLKSGTQGVLGRLQNELNMSLPGKVGNNLNSSLINMKGGKKTRKQKGGLGFAEISDTVVTGAQGVGTMVKGEVYGNLPGNVGSNLTNAVGQMGLSQLAASASQLPMKGGKKSRKQKAGALSACDFSEVDAKNRIETPGATPLGIASGASAGAQEQLYGDGYTRMRGPRDIVLGGLGVLGNGAVKAQMGVNGGGKKKLKGGADSSGVGSDWGFTVGSRGPANYPDGPSMDRFRIFNKSAPLIPNSMLKWYAAPISTGFIEDPNPYPQAYNDYCGGKKKPTKKAPKKSGSTKKKQTTRKNKMRLN